MLSKLVLWIPVLLLLFVVVIFLMRMIFIGLFSVRCITIPVDQNMPSCKLFVL